MGLLTHHGQLSIDSMPEGYSSRFKTIGIPSGQRYDHGGSINDSEGYVAVDSYWQDSPSLDLSIALGVYPSIGQYMYRSALAEDGLVYAPIVGTGNLYKYDTTNDAITYMTLSGGTYYLSAKLVSANDGYLYSGPWNDGYITKINPFTGAATKINTGLSFTSSAYIGGILGSVGAGNWGIYFIPYNESKILVYNIDLGTFSTIALPSGSYTSHISKFCGAAMDSNGIIYLPPWQYNHIVAIDTYSGTCISVNDLSTSSSYSGWTIFDTYWNSAILGHDGKIYFGSGNRRHLLKIDPSIYPSYSATEVNNIFPAPYAGQPYTPYAGISNMSNTLNGYIQWFEAEYQISGDGSNIILSRLYDTDSETIIQTDSYVHYPTSSHASAYRASCAGYIGGQPDEYALPPYATSIAASNYNLYRNHF